MSREIDVRDFSVNRRSASRESRLHAIASEVSDQLPGAHRVNIASFDGTTGNPALVRSESGPIEGGNYVQRALNHVQSIGRALGLEATQSAEFTADPNLQQTSSGSVTVHLQQRHKGIPIYQASETVRFSPSGALEETVGSTVTAPGDLDITPELPVEDAVMKAAQHVSVPQDDEKGAKDQFGEPIPVKAVDVKDFTPRIIATFPDKVDRPTVLEGGPFGDEIKASLLWFALGTELRLAWETIITMPRNEGQYRTIVDGRTGEILYCRQLVKTVVGRGNVYVLDGAGARQFVDFPRALTDYGLPLTNLPSGFPDDWITGNRTDGNSVFAHLGESGAAFQGAATNGTLTFDPTDPTGDDQKVLNIFYYNCYMHNFFYLLGFREADGNFQQSNLGRGGIQADRVDARAHSGAVFGTANMLTPVDGSRPVMNMGLVTATNRHTAFDSGVVFHEFTHGVTNRLVGGPLNVRALDAPQSAGMGEGWGDYVACTINDTDVVGAWVVNRPGGFRKFRYDADFPDHFGNLGTGRYTEEHNIGEIWCAAHVEMNRRIGKLLGVQLVVDALKLSPANPSFLDMRDAILKALDDKLSSGQVTTKQHGETRQGIWMAFAKLGMGPNARSSGANLSGIVADFTVPPDTTLAGVHVEATPNLVIPDNRPTGVSTVLIFPQAKVIARLAVSIDIQHTFRGDLQVSITSPGGQTVMLHDRTGGSAKNLIQSYTSDGASGLATLIGQLADGPWTLKVADLAGADVGTLRRWSLDFGLAP